MWIILLYCTVLEKQYLLCTVPTAKPSTQPSGEHPTPTQDPSLTPEWGSIRRTRSTSLTARRVWRRRGIHQPLGCTPVSPTSSLIVLGASYRLAFPETTGRVSTQPPKMVFFSKDFRENSSLQHSSVRNPEQFDPEQETKGRKIQYNPSCMRCLVAYERPLP